MNRRHSRNDAATSDVLQGCGFQKREGLARCDVALGGMIRQTQQIGRALEYAGHTHTVEDIEQGVAEGRFQKWAGDESTIITEILETPRRKTVHFFLAEGLMDELEVMTPLILEWARSIGCTHASLVGREGWRRVKWMADDGWEFRHVVMEKAL